MKRRDIYVIIIVSAIAIITFGITIMIFRMRESNISKENLNKGEIINITNTAKEENIIEEVLVQKTNASEEKISPNALITFNKFYKGCKHTTKKKEGATEEIVNKTKEDLQEIYSKWEITKFTSNEIELYKEVEGNCEEHYLVKENNGVIGIFKMDNLGNETLIEETEISLNYLPEQDVLEIKEGVKIYGKEKLNAYLEDFE